MQTAPLHRVDGEENGSDAGTPSNSGSLDGLPPTSRAEAPVGDEGVSPALATFIARTVQAALAAERAGQRTPQVTTNQPSSSLAEASNPSVPAANTTSSCSGGVPPSVPTTHRRHRFVDGGVRHFFPYSGVVLSESLERFDSV